MAGHAPELLPPARRLLRWLTDLSDLRISFYMLLAAAAVGVVLYLVDRAWLG